MAVTKVLSIEVTDIVTRVIEVDYGKKDPVVHKAIVFSTPEKTVSDGVIEGVETLAKEFQRQTHGFGTKNAVFTLATNKVMSREVTIPEMKDDQIPDFIMNQKSEYFPMDTSGHTMVHRILDRDKEKKQIKIIVYAVPQKLVSNYQAFASLAGLNIVSIDYSGNSIYQWLSNESHKEMDMYLQINERSTLFTVLEKRKFALQRNINFGAYALSDRLIQSGYLDGDDPSQVITRHDALKRLTEEELMFPSFAAVKLSEPDTEEAERLHSTKEQITEAMRQLLGNLSRVLEYYHSKNQNAELNTIFIGGCGAKIKGIKAFLENEFSGVEIICLDQLPNVKVSSVVAKSNINTSELIACLGAAEGSLTFIVASKAEKANKMIFLGIIVVAAAIAAAIGLVLWGKGKVKTEERNKEKLQITIDDLQKSGIEELEAKYNRAQSNITEVMNADSKTHRHSEEWNDLLKMLEERSITSLTVNSLSESGDSLSFGVVVDSKLSVAKTIMQFQTMPYFSSVKVNSFSEAVDSLTGYTTVSFSVQCTLADYYGQDINGDNVVDEKDDKNGDGVVNKLDMYGDKNKDGAIDIRDVEAAEEEIRQSIRALLESDINNDGMIDMSDDINQDGIIDSLDREAYIAFEAGLIPEAEGADDLTENTVNNDEEVTE